jgi:ATP-dependent DNA helicase RecG
MAGGRPRRALDEPVGKMPVPPLWREQAAGEREPRAFGGEVGGQGELRDADEAAHEFGAGVVADECGVAVGGDRFCQPAVEEGRVMAAEDQVGVKDAEVELGFAAEGEFRVDQQDLAVPRPQQAAEEEVAVEQVRVIVVEVALAERGDAVHIGGVAAEFAGEVGEAGRDGFEERVERSVGAEGEVEDMRVVEGAHRVIAQTGGLGGREVAQGISPTEHEFLHATKHRKTRLIYVWGADEARRAPKMKGLIRRASAELVRRRVEDITALNSEVYASLVDYLDQKGALRVPPFDTTAGDGATLADLSPKRLTWFLDTARRERGFPLKLNTAPEALLKHLNLLDGRRPTNAALLLFGAAPQRFHRTAETKCVSCHGTEYRRPFASQQIYGGDVFEQADQARDFVLAKLNRAVGTRATSITAPATYELPPDAVGEAIVNAIAHRDYYSHASVEIRLFADRLEVWNPGALPGNLALADLSSDHPSIPANPLIAESLYLTRYIEKAGSGTQRMIELCRAAGLPEPSFELRAGSFVLTLWRDWLTDDVVAGLELSERQLQAITHIKRHGRITNADYQQLTQVARKTASRDLDGLVVKGVFRLVGAKRGSHYVLGGKK